LPQEHHQQQQQEGDIEQQLNVLLDQLCKTDQLEQEGNDNAVVPNDKGMQLLICG
jgi:hypothetical protein